MGETFQTVVGLLILFIGIPVGLLLLRDKVFKRRKLIVPDEASIRHEQALLNPKLDELARHFGGALPRSLIQLYGDGKELVRDDFEVFDPRKPKKRWYVAYYEPACADSIVHHREGAEQYFAFAVDGCGNSFLVDVKQPDPPVLFHDHETDELEPVSRSLGEFMSWPRTMA